MTHVNLNYDASQSLVGKMKLTTPTTTTNELALYCVTWLPLFALNTLTFFVESTEVYFFFFFILCDEWMLDRILNDWKTKEMLESRVLLASICMLQVLPDCWTKSGGGFACKICRSRWSFFVYLIVSKMAVIIRILQFNYTVVARSRVFILSLL